MVSTRFARERGHHKFIGFTRFIRYYYSVFLHWSTISLCIDSHQTFICQFSSNLAVSVVAMASLTSTVQSGLFSCGRPMPPVAARPRQTVVVKAAEAINPDIRKTEEKVVDAVVVTELAKPLTAYCRCWRSGTFPLCDGSHVKHNKATGDNVGPLLLKKQ
ncbi:CDGSH iron-sulfur domain-containing protein NEET [Abeliophyllum distichum]|uniref:CDGSH iron-sulfur domain-containing protein NEET n=1 Tax=Abeliophyllum distichum TaxID=126358 RepID=A0ABD1URS3_9LAMI